MGRQAEVTHVDSVEGVDKEVAVAAGVFVHLPVPEVYGAPRVHHQHVLLVPVRFLPLRPTTSPSLFRLLLALQEIQSPLNLQLSLYQRHF